MMEAEKVMAVLHQDQAAYVHRKIEGIKRQWAADPDTNVAFIYERHIRWCQEDSAREYAAARYQMGIPDEA